MTATDATPTVPEEKGKLPEPRIRDGEQGHGIFKQLRTDDEEASWKRGNIDYLIGGGLPYSEAAMIDAGRGEDANVNFMEGKAEDDAAQTPFIEMTTVTRILWNIRTAYGDLNEQKRYSQIISEEHTRTVREWGADFDYYRLRLAQQFTRHGVGFLYWENEIDWRWRTDGLAAFRVPRDTESRPSAIPYATCDRSMSVDELYGFIRNEDRAKEVGRWNVEAVKQALCHAVGLSQNWNDGGWEEFQKQARENDCALGAKYKVKLYHLWVRELKNGSISHYIGLQSGVCAMGEDKIGNGFLYEHRSRFKSLDRCIIPFFYGIGTYGTIHSIRGQGEMNFGPISVGNRAWCRLLDCASASSSIVMQADTPNDAEGAAYVQRGPFLIVSGNTKINPTAMPDVSQRMLPVQRAMQMLRQNVSGSYQSRAIAEGGAQERTKYEVQAQQNQNIKLGSAGVTLFFGPWSNAGKESFDRMMNPKLRDDDPGGAEAFDFRMRCMKRGVPMAALEAVYSVEAVRAIGYGSPEARQNAAEQIYKLSGGFDDVGRKRATRDLVASIPTVDYQAADDYVGPDEGRKTIDDQIAELENNDFRAGQKVPVTDGQEHWTHCQHHAALVTEIVGAFEQGQMDGAQLVPVLSAALDNMLQHSEQLSLDPSREKEAGYVRKFIQEQGGTLEQQENKLVAEMQRQQEEQAQGGGQEQQPPDGEDARKWEVHQQDMMIREEEFAMRQREFEQKLAQQSQDAVLKRSQADIKLAAELADRRNNLSSEIHA